MNKDYTGDIEGMELEEQDKTFVTDVVAALKNIEKSPYGKGIISDLVESSNIITIQSGKSNSYSETSTVLARANLSYYQKKTNAGPNNKGSGGTIKWNNNQSKNCIQNMIKNILPQFL